MWYFLGKVRRKTSIFSRSRMAAMVYWGQGTEYLGGRVWASNNEQEINKKLDEWRVEFMGKPGSTLVEIPFWLAE
jgi:hypothetical protein